MAASRRSTRKGGTKNTNITPTKSWDTESKVDKNDERANTQAGDAGKEPGGRWSPAYYESPAKIIGRDDVRTPGENG